MSRAWSRSGSAVPHGAVPGHVDANARSVTFMPDSPSRSGSARPMTVAPYEAQVRDWEGLMANEQLAASYAASSRQAADGSQRRRGESPMPRTYKTEIRREGSPSAAVLAPAEAAARQAMTRGPVPAGRAGGNRSGMNQTPLGSSRGGGGGVHDRPEHLVDHQTYLEFRRKEYARRLEADKKGTAYKPRSYGDAFMRQLPGGVDHGRQMMTTGINFEGRSGALGPQIVGGKDEIAWLHPPQIPPPLNWNDYWDLCPGHELLLQLMAVSGVTPGNSPSLVEHFMYKELLSCVQRMQYGTYLIHYQKGEPPHERYFYVKSLPLANKAQYCPFLCWATHKNAHQASDLIPMCNVMWVTTGMDTPVLKKYAVGDGEHISGPYVGKKKPEMLGYGCLSVWIYDGRKMRVVELLATDPLVFTMWMKLLEDVAQMNAALDTSGSVRALQRQIEELRVAGELDRAITTGSSSSNAGFVDKFFGPRIADDRR
jgi:hypothetical protein